MFGVQLPIQTLTRTLVDPWEDEATVADLATVAQTADELGFGFVGVCDHVAIPDNDYAARLIEQTGLKGRIRGDAEVSRQHANFIVNRGRASARDIETLIEEVRQEVRSAHGVELVPEVRVIGEFL